MTGADRRPGLQVPGWSGTVGYILQGVWFLKKCPLRIYSMSGTEEAPTTKSAHFTAAANAFARLVKTNPCVLRDLMPVPTPYP